MPVRFERLITPAMCRAEPETLWVFGDNLRRAGMGGQAVIRGLPNAVGIPTKRAPSWRDWAFFTDADLARYNDASTDAWVRLMEHVAVGGEVVLPFDDLGTGRAELKRRAPRVWAELQSDVNELVRMAKTTYIPPGFTR
jgi:hypothetical protein